MIWNYGRRDAAAVEQSYTTGTKVGTLDRPVVGAPQWKTTVLQAFVVKKLVTNR